MEDVSRTYPVEIAGVTETFLGCQPEFTVSDHQPCQVRVQTTVRRCVTLGGHVGDPAFDARWAAALIANDPVNVEARQLLFDALPPLAVKDRLAISVAAMEE